MPRPWAVEPSRPYDQWTVKDIYKFSVCLIGLGTYLAEQVSHIGDPGSEDSDPSRKVQRKSGQCVIKLINATWPIPGPSPYDLMEP